MISDPLSALLDVVGILDELEIPYAVGGSVASSVFGEPRASADADLIAEISQAQLGAFLARLEGAYYVSEDAARDAAKRHTSFNIIHLDSMYKVVIFVAGPSAMDREQLRRRVRHRPRLLSDNGPAYVSSELRDYLAEREMKHTRGRPYHPMTQGKIECYHRSMKNVVKLEHYYPPGDLERSIANFVEYYNNERYHESLDNVTPADVYFGRQRDVLTARDRIKLRTLKLRRQENRAAAAA